MMNGFGMNFAGFGFLLIALFWIFVIVAAVWLLGNLFPRSNTARPDAGPAESAIDILKQRYARGELSKEAYEAMRQDLEQ